ncbi:MAG: rhodanese-like domain-containing protein [Anaeromyxobacter sp.]
MRRLLALAFACALAASGCSDDKSEPKTPPASKGTYGTNYWVSVSAGEGGKITSSNGAIDCGATCGAFYAWSTAAVLAATPDAGHTFRAWSGACTGAAVAGNVCTLPSGQALDSAGDRVAVAIFDTIPANFAPVVAAFASGQVTEAPLQVMARAVDPDAADTIACTFTLAAQPTGSDLVLPATSGDCRAADLVATVTPHVPGTYTFQVAATDGHQTTTAQVSATLASGFGGGAVSGTQAAVSPEYAALRDRLIQVQGNVGSVTAQAAAKEYMDALAAATPALPYNVIDLRDAADFAAGHIPGAVNVPFQTLPDVLLANPNFPEARSLAKPAKKVLVAGYYAADSIEGSFFVTAARCGAWGCTGAAGATNPIPAAQRSYSLQHGMSSWTYDVAVSPFRFDDDLGVHRIDAAGTDVSTDAFVAPASTNPFPALGAFTGATTLTQQILVRARAWLAWQETDAAAEGVPHREAFHTNFVRWDKLKKDADTANDPALIVFQSAAQWTAGHPVATATAPVIQTTAALLNVGPVAGNVFQQLKADQPVYVCCFSGISEVPPTIMLGVLGYKAKAILYGISGWTTATARGANVSNWDAGALGNDFPLAKGSTEPCADPAASSCTTAFGAATAARAGCELCHANYSAHYYDIALAPPAGATVEVASEGEG